MVCDGEIQLILGPMFSGKSTELLRRIRRYSIAKQRCMVVKYKNDTRYSKEALSTHDRVTFDAVPADALAPLREASLSYDVIGVDEGQFFPDIVEFAESLANLGKVVVISALDGTFQRKPFGRILDLVPFAEHVTKLNAVCAITCREAAFSKRTTSDTAIEVIGGNDMYIPVSRAAFLASSAEEAERHPAAYGSIELILGPMFSGKSTELLRRIRRHSVAKRRCLVLKYKRDTRYSQKMVTTHDMQSAEALPCDDLFAQADACEDYDVIGIDEGQFFSGVHEFAEQMANQGKTVVIAALDGTFQRRPFGSILEVIPYAERVTKLSAVCAITQKDAAFTMRTTMQQEVEVIGGSEMYLPVSRSAFFEPVSTGSKRRSPGKRGG